MQYLYTILMSEDVISSVISPHLSSAPVDPEATDAAVEGTPSSKSDHFFLLLGLAYIKDRDEAARIARLPSERIESLLGYVDAPELIHRDNMVLV